MPWEIPFAWERSPEDCEHRQSFQRIPHRPNHNHRPGQWYAQPPL